MNSTLMPILENAISKVMSEMFFLFPDYDEGLEEKKPGPEICYRLKLGAPGQDPVIFFFSFEQALANLMTTNFLGVDVPEQQEEMVLGTVQEAVNMFVGNVLNQMDTTGDYVMGLPELITTEGLPAGRPADLSNRFEGAGLQAWIAGE